MSCFPTHPVNPLSQTILSLLGPNFFPLFDSQFQAVDASKLTQEPLLQMKLPGGGSIKPWGNDNDVHLSETVAAITGALGTVFSFFAPLFIVLDVIRAIIDIICALFNPVPLILTVVDLFVNVLPPLIALFPPFSSILLALDTVKLITAVIGSLVAALIPIAIEIVDITVQVTEQLSKGNIPFLDAAELKICQLLQVFANKIGGLLPLSFIFDLIDLFMSIGSQGFCTNQSPCCTVDNCPPIIINPAGGLVQVIQRTQKFTLADLINSIIDLINIPLDLVTKFFNVTINPLLNLVVGVAVKDIIGAIKALLDEINTVLVGALTGFIKGLNLNSVSIDVPNIDLHIDHTTNFQDVILIQPSTTFNILTRVSTPNPNGLVSSVGVGFTYSAADLKGMPKYVVEPDKIPAPGSDPDPASMRVVVSGATVNGGQGAVTQRVQTTDGQTFTIRDDSFPLNSKVNYVFQPDEINLIKLDLIGLGCHSGLTAARQGINKFIQADAGATLTGDGFSSAASKIGQTFPRPPTDALNQLLQQITNDPKTFVDPTPILNKYLDDLGKFSDSLLCIGASSTRSIFTVSNKFPQQGETVLLTLQVNDAGGNNLLIGGVLPNSTFKAQFYTTFGTLGPVTFDATSGIFTGTLTSEIPGHADVQAAFLVRDKECMRAKVFDGFNVTVNVQPVEFVPERSSYPRQRRKDQFIQSRGGRVRK